MTKNKILKVIAREVLDSRGFPTVEVELTLNHQKRPSDVVVGRAIVPSGASTGEAEALELRDGDKNRYLGKGVLKALQNIQQKIAPAIENKAFTQIAELDRVLMDLDGTPNKSQLGANAILGVSMAFVRACALASDTPSDELIAKIFQTSGNTLPVPLMNIINGGKHADNDLDIQEFMIVPAGFSSFSEALRAGVETFHHLKKLLKDQGLSTSVGDEGGFAPSFHGKNPHEQALEMLIRAITSAGYRPGEQIFLALDSAASEFCEKNENKGSPITYLFEKKSLSAAEMIATYDRWSHQYPLISIEDGLAEQDWAGWKDLTEQLGDRLQLVGDDLFVTNPIFLKKGIETHTANAILIKLNQIGTVTETLETMKLAQESGFQCIVSHRSGETEDTFIADLAVGTNCGQIKAGSASRTDRVAKYNQLLRLEERLGKKAVFPGTKPFLRKKR